MQRLLASMRVGARGLALSALPVSVLGVIAVGALAAHPRGGATYLGGTSSWRGSLKTSGNGRSFRSGSFHIRMHCSNGKTVEERWNPTGYPPTGNKPIPISARGRFHAHRFAQHTAQESGGQNVGPVNLSETISGRFATDVQIGGTYTTHLYYVKYGISCSRKFALRLYG
jgi:hypothetical protein